MSSKCPVTSQVQSTDSPGAPDINIQLLEDSIYLQADDSGYVCMTGLCTKIGSDQAFFIFVSVEFFNAYSRVMPKLMVLPGILF